MKCVLQGERSLLMQFPMKVTVEGPEGSHSGIEAETFKNCCCGCLLSRLTYKGQVGEESLASYPGPFAKEKKKH